MPENKLIALNMRLVRSFREDYGRFVMVVQPLPRESLLYCQYSISPMITVKLREAMKSYRLQTGERLTYEILARRSGLSLATLQSLATRSSYNTTLSTIEKLCRVLSCTPGDLLELEDDQSDS